jgi:hypothetical protein
MRLRCGRGLDIGRSAIAGAASTRIKPDLQFLGDQPSRCGSGRG